MILFFFYNDETQNLSGDNCPHWSSLGSTPIYIYIYIFILITKNNSLIKNSFLKYVEKNYLSSIILESLIK